MCFRMLRLGSLARDEREPHCNAVYCRSPNQMEFDFLSTNPKLRRFAALSSWQVTVPTFAQAQAHTHIEASHACCSAGFVVIRFNQETQPDKQTAWANS